MCDHVKPSRNQIYVPEISKKIIILISPERSRGQMLVNYIRDEVCWLFCDHYNFAKLVCVSFYFMNSDKLKFTVNR